MTTSYTVWHRNQMCSRKKTLLSETVASNFAWLVELAHGTPMSTYRCLYCGDWHITKRQNDMKEVG